MSILIRKLGLSLLLVFFFFSCDNGNDNDAKEEHGAADFPFEQLMNEEISMMSLNVSEHEGQLYASIDLHIKEEHENLTLMIDGDTILLEGWQGYYYAYLEDLVPEQQITYELDIDGEKREGSLNIPAVITAEHPEEFDLNDDYSFSWQIARDPMLFLVWMYIDMEEEADQVYDANLLAGNQRSHTFSENLYSGVSEEDIRYILVEVAALNFELKDDMAFLAEFESYHYYDFGHRKAAERKGSGFIRWLRLAE